MSFADLGVSRPVAGALRKRGITAPFAIQKLVIEDVLDGDDVLVQSPTGSGKTLAFGIPLVDLIEPDDRHPAALILAPTRELALQIVDELSEIAAARSLSIAPVYGGVGLEQQARAPPGPRSSSPPRAGSRTCSSAARSASSTSACWSSTRPTGCSTWASSPPSTGSSPGPRAIARRCSSRRRSRPRPASSLAPTPTTPSATSTSPCARTAARSSTASSTSSTPTRSGRWSPSCAMPIAAGRWSSCAPSAARTGSCGGSASRASRRWRCTATSRRASASAPWRASPAAEIETLVATDVAARGIDVDEIAQVINYDAPGDRDAYVHRVGRSGRAGADGAGVSFVLPDQRAEMRKIASSLGLSAEFEHRATGGAPASTTANERRGARRRRPRRR